MNVVLISTYELGHQPFGLASPAAWLQAEGATVTCLDLAVQRLDPAVVAAADLVAFYVPMHTATRLAARAARRVRAINPRAHLCFYGLYAVPNADYLRTLGAGTLLSGEFEEGLAALVRRLAQDPAPAPTAPAISLARQPFRVPERGGLPPLDRYAALQVGPESRRVAGYTEASRGCKHLCRHCPIVPIYRGRFRIVPQAVVLEDIRRQVRAGAQHITFGDPDFWNGPGHARAVVQALHAEFPDLTYDVTIKVEHLVKRAADLALLKETGCALITTAVESIDPAVLARLDKGHTCEDFVRAVALCRAHDLVLQPTFVTFTPWTTPASYLELLARLAELELVDAVAPVQLAIRLLIPAGSRLLELAEVQQLIGPFDAEILCYPWQHADPRVDRLYTDVRAAVQTGLAQQASRRAIFAAVWELAAAAAGVDRPQPATVAALQGARPKTIPYLTEAWYC